MALSKSVITGKVQDAGENGLSSAQLVWTLSGVDTESAAALLPAELSVALAADGAIPAAFSVWKNTAGLRATHYRLRLRGLRQSQPGFTEVVDLFLGNVQVGAAASYTIAELLNNPVPDAPSWNVNLDPDLYQELQDDMAAAGAASVAAAASAASALASATSAAGDAATAADAATDAVAAAEKFRNFATWADAIAALAGGWVPASGALVTIAGLAFMGKTGATAIGLLPGLVPFGNMIESRHFGDNAVPGTTNFLASINAAITYVLSLGGGQVWIIGDQRINGAILGSDKVALRSPGPVAGRILRDGNFSSYVQVGGAVDIEGIGWQHGTYTAQLDPGVVPALDYRLTGTAAHFDLTNCTPVRIKLCNIYRMPYGVKLDGCNNLDIDENLFAGTWHPTIENLQESVASIWLGGARTKYNQIFNARRNRMVGSVGPKVDTDYTDGTSVRTRPEKEGNFGPRHHFLVNNIEMLLIEGNYINRSSDRACVVNLLDEWPCYGLKIIGNTFDAGIGQPTEGMDVQIDFFDRIENRQVREVIVTGNLMVGYNKCVHAIRLGGRQADPSQPVVYGGVISGNIFMGYVGAPILAEAVEGVAITGNVGKGYNWLGFGDVNKRFVAGIYVGPYAESLAISGNILGGGNTNFGDNSAKGYNCLWFVNPDDATHEVLGNVWEALEAGGVVHNWNFNRDVAAGAGWYRKTTDGALECWGDATLSFGNAAWLVATIDWPHDFVTGSTPFFYWQPSWNDLEALSMARKAGCPSYGAVNHLQGVARLPAIHGMTDWSAGQTVAGKWLARGRWKA
jgi:hypothetical protein